MIPAYNAERTIGFTLESVLRQTVPDLELIVVDDGSTDRTASVAGATSDPRVAVVHQANAGHASARNTGIAHARGQYVAFLDADDLWLPSKLERQLAILRGDRQIRALQTGVVYVDDAMRPLSIGHGPDGANELLDVLCFRGLPGMMDTLIAERTLLNDVGGFDPSLIILQDWDLAIRLARLGELHSISEPLALYRKHASSQSTQLDIHIEPGERILAGLFEDPTVPREIVARRRYVYAHFYAMLCGGAYQLHRFSDSAYWGHKAIQSDRRVLPYLLGLPVRRMQKRISRIRAAHLIRDGALGAG